MTNQDRPCGVCGATMWTEAHRGPIRDGVFGRSTDGVVLRCSDCGVGFLGEPRATDPRFYTSGAYRASVGEGGEAADYFARHDHEQWDRYGLLGDFSVRGGVIADVGCGAGSFLDGLRGFAAETIAVEPSEAYHASLRERGHRVFADTAAAEREYGARVDYVFCFSVVEHVEEPADFARGLRRLLRPSGVALVSTPNAADILMALDCEPYRQFFYRVVHRYYFDARSLQRLAAVAGFSDCRLIYRHRFGFGNFVNWLGAGRPSGRGGTHPLGAAFDPHWRAALESAGAADYLFAYLSA